MKWVDISDYARRPAELGKTGWTVCGVKYGGRWHYEVWRGKKMMASFDTKREAERMVEDA